MRKRFGLLVALGALLVGVFGGAGVGHAAKTFTLPPGWVFEAIGGTGSVTVTGSGAVKLCKLKDPQMWLYCYDFTTGYNNADSFTSNQVFSVFNFGETDLEVTWPGVDPPHSIMVWPGTTLRRLIIPPYVTVQFTNVTTTARPVAFVQTDVLHSTLQVSHNNGSWLQQDNSGRIFVPAAGQSRVKTAQYAVEIYYWATLTTGYEITAYPTLAEPTPDQNAPDGPVSYTGQIGAVVPTAADSVKMEFRDMDTNETWTGLANGAPGATVVMAPEESWLVGRIGHGFNVTVRGYSVAWSVEGPAVYASFSYELEDVDPPPCETCGPDPDPPPPVCEFCGPDSPIFRPDDAVAQWVQDAATVADRLYGVIPPQVLSIGLTSLTLLLAIRYFGGR